MAKFDLVIFDFDGTMADTRYGICAGVNRTLKEFNMNYHYEPEEIDKFLGYGDVVLFCRAFHQEGLNDENKDLWKAFKKNYLEEQLSNLHEFDGVSNLLDELNRNNVKIMVYSNKPDEILQDCVRVLFPKTSFIGVFGNKPGFIKKPDPSWLISYLEKNKYDFSRVLYVGDSKPDGDFANNAKIKCCMMLYGYDTCENINLTNPTYVAENIKNLREIIL